MSQLCEMCGRPFDRPSFYGECAFQHPEPTAAQRLADAVETMIHGRKGIGWRSCDDEIVQNIRDDLARIAEEHLGKAVAAERQACAALVRDIEHPIGFMTAEERHVVRMAQDSLAKAIEERGGGR